MILKKKHGLSGKDLKDYKALEKKLFPYYHSWPYRLRNAYLFLLEGLHYLILIIFVFFASAGMMGVLYALVKQLKRW